MTDDLDIRAGGAVAVDTATLHAAADAFARIAAELDETAAQVGSAGNRLFSLAHDALQASSAVNAAGFRIREAAAGASELATALRTAAAVYEIVELRAARAVADAAGDSGEVQRIDRRLAALALAYPDAETKATVGTLEHWLAWPAELAMQAPGALWWLAPGFHTIAVPAAWAFQRAAGTLGAGTVPRTARLSGAPAGVTVMPVAPRGPTTAPTTLASAAARIPGGGDSRVRVERYTMPDGSRAFAVYVAGTQTSASPTETFDMGSNVELYTGQNSASFEATDEALRQAGAQPGDVVHAFGHSQGAMVAAHLALEGGYDTRTLVSFGSPVTADVGDNTLSVSVRHSDDPVTALAGGGHTGPVGAPGSFIAERVADPQAGIHDLALPAHGMDSYSQTAEMLDASTDARMAAVRHVFDQLGSAASVEVTEYSAAQPLPAPRPNPGRVPVPPVSPSAAAAG